MPVLLAETSRDILDAFLARTHGDIEVQSYEEYSNLMHDCGLPQALKTIVTQHPMSEQVGQHSDLHRLILRNTSSKITAIVREDDRGPIMIQYNGGTPREAYTLHLKAGWLGDIVTRQGKRSMDRETYMTFDSLDRVRPADHLTKLIRLSRKPLERFAQLTIV